MVPFLTLLPLMALSGAENREPYPARDLLATFATACSGIENLDVAKASAIAAGWEQIEPEPNSVIGRLVEFGRGAVKADEGVTLLSGGTYRRDRSGRELFLVISGVAMSGASSHGCRLYDFEAQQPLTEQVLADWAARKPNPVATGIAGGSKFVWNPGLKPGHMEMEASFVPRGVQFPPPMTGVPLSGIVLTATAIEFTNP